MNTCKRTGLTALLTIAVLAMATTVASATVNPAGGSFTFTSGPVKLVPPTYNMNSHTVLCSSATLSGQVPSAPDNSSNVLEATAGFTGCYTLGTNGLVNQPVTAGSCDASLTLAQSSFTFETTEICTMRLTQYPSCELHLYPSNTYSGTATYASPTTLSLGSNPAFPAYRSSPLGICSWGFGSAGWITATLSRQDGSAPWLNGTPPVFSQTAGSQVTYSN